MTTAAKNPRKEEKPAGFVGFVKNSYRKTMDASELVSLTAVNLPYVFLEALGVPEERTKGLKGINERFVGGVYKGTDWVATRAVGAYIAPFKWVGNGVSRLATGRRPAAKKAPKKAEAKKPAAKKVAKKAPKAKKAPPKVARRPVKAKGRAAAKLAA